MDKEKSEQIKIALLGVIALTLIIETVNMPSGPVRQERTGVQQNQPGSPQVTFNNNPGGNVQTPNPIAQSIPQVAQTIQPAPVASTTMTFDQTAGDLGSTSVADNKTFTYTVSNTGTNPLTINSLTADPGLTIVTQPSAPITPGSTGEITVKLAPEAEKGLITKTIHVGTNTEPNHMHLTLTADVK